MKIKFNIDELRLKGKMAIKKVATYTALATVVSFFACTAKSSIEDMNTTVIETSIDDNDDEIDIESISSNDISNNEIDTSSNDIGDNDTIKIEEENVPLATSAEVIDERKCVAITFDDGPGIYTDRLLDILKENDCKATFFVLGYNFKRYGDAVTREYNEGHEIGIHGYSHKFYTNKDRNTGEELGLGIEGTREEIVTTYNMLRELYVEPSNIVRPPGGKITNEIIENLNYSFILWSVDTRDWESRNKDKIKEEILNNIEEGSIILLHDIHECSVDAVEELLPELTKEYRFVTVSELFDILDNDLETCTSYRKVKVLK